MADLPADDIPKDLQIQAEQTAVLQRDVESQIKLLKETQSRIDNEWARVKEVMISNSIKSVKGEWGSITIAERSTYKGEADEIPPKFLKKVIDTAKVQAHHVLTGELPKGVEVSTTQYLTKRLK